MTATLTNWKTNIVDRIDGGEKSFRVSLKIFGEALTRSRGGNWAKNITAVTSQRVSKKRARTDVIVPFYFKINPDTGICWGYDHIIANMSNVLVVPLVDMKDTFGNLLKQGEIYQADGNTGLVAQCQLANGDIDLPKGYDLSHFIAEDDATLDFDVIAIKSIHELDKYYDVLDNSVSAKSKDDNYSSVLVGHNLIDYETGETDMIDWVTSAMDGPINLITGSTVPKDVPNMNKVVEPLLPVIRNVQPYTILTIKWAKERSAIFKAFLLDITKLQQDGKVSFKYNEELFDALNEKINALVDSDLSSYWNSRFFVGKTPHGASKIETSLKSFDKFVCSTTSSWTQLYFTIEDWILWELFPVTREILQNAQDQRLYGHGGKDILGGKNRKDSSYQSLNFLRILYLYALTLKPSRRFTAQEAFEWASDTLCKKCAAIDQVDRLDILSDKKVKSSLMEYIY